MDWNHVIMLGLGTDIIVKDYEISLGAQVRESISFLQECEI
jgi:hypothetical protein